LSTTLLPDGARYSTAPLEQVLARDAHLEPAGVESLVDSPDVQQDHVAGVGPADLGGGLDPGIGPIGAVDAGQDAEAALPPDADLFQLALALAGALQHRSAAGAGHAQTPIIGQ
jgi:hypothetical protein